MLIFPEKTRSLLTLVAAIQAKTAEDKKIYPKGIRGNQGDICLKSCLRFLPPHNTFC